MIKDKKFDSGIFIGLPDVANEPILISYGDVSKEPNTLEVANRNHVIIIDTEKEYKELAEILEPKLITINTNDFTKIDPFEIEVEEEYSRQDILSRIKSLTVIANKSEEIEKLIKELADKNNFKITDDEISSILNS